MGDPLFSMVNLSFRPEPSVASLREPDSQLADTRLAKKDGLGVLSDLPVELIDQIFGRLKI